MPPPRWPEPVVLLDGSVALLRDVEAADEPELRRLFAGMAPEMARRRWFGAATSMPANARWAAHPEAAGAVGLVAEQDGHIVAHGVAVPDGPEAEVAFAVADDRHGVGLATTLLQHLAARALELGFDALRAHVLWGNREMLEVLEHACPTSHKSRDGDGIHVRVSARAIVRNSARALPYKPATGAGPMPEVTPQTGP
ncbi:MAG TPA: GNAT family N-acetyltransferase [Baekduia sp.]|nr:GNAT family N-acetyltransferase [Baekduia sp.]